MSSESQLGPTGCSCNETKSTTGRPPMTRRQRILATLQSRQPDRLPFYHFWRHSQVGWAERECRNRGMGMNWVRPPYVEKLHDVRVTEEPAQTAGKAVIRRTYHTPIGSVYEDEFREPGTGQWHANRSWNGNTPWITDRLIKTFDDYAVVKFIVEHTEYAADYFPIEQAMDWLGDDGVVLAGLPHSPMQTLMVNWVGSEHGRFFYHFADEPGVVEDLYRTISKCRQPMYEIAAKSPATVVACGDNLDGVLVSPKMFEKYEYEQEAAVIHAHGKFMSVHMDGRLNSLKHLIARTPVDIVEALHAPPLTVNRRPPAAASFKYVSVGRLPRSELSRRSGGRLTPNCSIRRRRR